MRVQAIPYRFDFFLDRRARFGCVLFQPHFRRIKPEPISSRERVTQIHDPLRPLFVRRCTGCGHQMRFRMTIGQDHQQRRRFRQRTAIDDERRHHAVRIEFQIFGAVLRAFAEVDEFEAIRRADFQQGEVNNHAGRTGGVVEGIHERSKSYAQFYQVPAQGVWANASALVLNSGSALVRWRTDESCGGEHHVYGQQQTCSVVHFNYAKD